MDWDLGKTDLSLIAISTAVVILLGGILLVAAAFRYEILNYRETRLYVQILGVMATVILVSVYLQIILNRQRSETRERRSRLYEDMIREVVQPALEAVEENKNRIQSARWNETVHRASYNTISRDLGADAAEIDRFSSEYGDIYQKMEEHDSKMNDVLSLGTQLHYQLEILIEREFFELEGAPSSNDIDPGLFAEYLLNGRSPQADSDVTKIWVENIEELSNIRDEELSPNYSGFKELREEYIELSRELSSDLREIRDELRTEYGLTIDSVRTE